MYSGYGIPFDEAGSQNFSNYFARNVVNFSVVYHLIIVYIIGYHLMLKIAKIIF